VRRQSKQAVIQPGADRCAALLPPVPTGCERLALKAGAAPGKLSLACACRSPSFPGLVGPRVRVRTGLPGTEKPLTRRGCSARTGLRELVAPGGARGRQTV